jgi:serine/threonine-protein kinase
VEQFEKEVRLLSKISHEGVIKMYDAFVEDHRAYLVLEHVDGVSLRDYVQRSGPIESSRAVALAQKMCDILAHLHSMQPSIMHLDFSPENIWISANDRITAIDFNISVEENSLRTRTVMGKQRYMAPEQYRGKPTMRSDIYSMGATLFFLLTGKEPEPISVSRPARENAQIDAQLENIVEQATALEEEKRFQSAASLKEALVVWQEQTMTALKEPTNQTIKTASAEQCHPNLRN